MLESIKSFKSKIVKPNEYTKQFENNFVDQSQDGEIQDNINRMSVMTGSR